MAPAGTTRDGSPIAAYLAMPARPEFDPLVDALPAGASVLDLGCGAGRLSNLLAHLGHEVVGVDESADMLAHLDPRVEGVQSRIEALDLGRAFDAVVLASNLVNTADLRQRAGFLAAVRRHLHREGRAFVQRYDPAWAATATEHVGSAGPVRVHVEVESRTGPVFEARSTYQLGDRTWVQRFRARLVDDDELTGALARWDLDVERWLTPRWAVVMEVPSTRSTSAEA